LIDQYKDKLNHDEGFLKAMCAGYVDIVDLVNKHRNREGKPRFFGKLMTFRGDISLYQTRAGTSYPMRCSKKKKEKSTLLT